MTDRAQKLKSLRRRLQNLRESAGALENELWWRSHSAVITHRKGRPGYGYGGTAVALCDADLVKKGHGGYSVDVAGESATARHITSACPERIADIIKRLDDLYPELKWEEPT